MKLKTSYLSPIVAGTLLAVYHTAWSAEGFQVRYNLAGTLGGEMFAPPAQPGWAGGIATTYIDVEKVTGGDGNVLTSRTPGGSVPVPGLPAALSPQYAANTVQVDGTGTFKLLNLGLGYVTTDRYAGGRLAFVLNLPMGKKTQSFRSNGSTPTLNWNPAVPASVQTTVNAGFNRQYQASLTAQAASETGEVTGIGDTELQAGWLYVEDKLRFLAGASLVLPTGKYSSSAGPDIGFGDFYTFRPTVQAAYLVTPDFAVSGKFTLGLNTRNKDNDLRSGNWAGAELATGYKTAVGVIGLHGIHVQQYQDDDNNSWGTSRFRSTNAGVFFTTKIPIVDAALTLQFMKTTDSRNAKHGSFTQLRVAKVF